MNQSYDVISSVRCFGGLQRRIKHWSHVNQCDMTLTVYLPPGIPAGDTVPCIYWLSGLTCTDENFIQKAGAQRYAAEHSVALIVPDTSPRGEGIPDGAVGEWDLGSGAGFYVDATNAPWDRHYNMYSYIAEELPAFIGEHFPIQKDNTAIMGHSMGGHGALIIALRNPDKFKSVSAFSPICAPSQCEWGKKAFRVYLGENADTWRLYDSSELIKMSDYKPSILIDQGDEDEFLQDQLMPEMLQAASNEIGLPLIFRLQKGYDHSYFFISSFIGEHIDYHAKALHRIK